MVGWMDGWMVGCKIIFMAHLTPNDQPTDRQTRGALEDNDSRDYCSGPTIEAPVITIASF